MKKLNKKIPSPLALSGSVWQKKKKKMPVHEMITLLPVTSGTPLLRVQRLEILYESAGSCVGMARHEE